MLDRFGGGDWPVALLNIVLLILWSVLPILLVAYARQSMATRRIRPEFTLRKSEAAELDRALIIYHGVCRRLAEIEAKARTAKGILDLVLSLQPHIEQLEDDEREDLKAHARHLRATIVKLRGLPLRRLRARIVALSFHFSVGGAIAVYIAAFGLLVLTFFLPGARLVARDFAGIGRTALVWYPFDASYFLANGAGAALGMLCAPAFYAVRRIGLSREYAMELTVLKGLADTPADAIADPGLAAGCGDADEPRPDESCFAVLGVAQTATIEQVRAAYKMRIKQSHPDRLHDVSPAIRTFAEDETKRLNAALQEALERLA